MDLRENVYSVLLVSSSQSFNNSTKELLLPARFDPIFEADSVAEAKRHMASRNFDLVIINAPLTDEQGTRFAADCSNTQSTVVLILLRPDVQSDVYHRMEEKGVYTITKPTSHQMMTQALKWMTTSRERLRKLEQKTAPIEARMEEIRVINRAKMLLISELKMTEPEAHHHIEKQAMDKGISKRAEAEQIIKELAV